MSGKTPEEAAHESARYVQRLTEIEHTLPKVVAGHKQERANRDNYLAEAEAYKSFSDTIVNSLQTIKSEPNPYIRKSLWADLLAFEVEVPVQVLNDNSKGYHARPEVYNAGYNIYEDVSYVAFTRDIKALKTTAVEEIFGDSPDILKDELVRSALGEAASGAIDHGRSLRAAYEAGIKSKSDRFNVELPPYEALPQAVLDELDKITKRLRELYVFGDETTEISDELSAYLDTMVDVLLNDNLPRQQEMNQGVEDVKALYSLDDAAINRSARAIIDETQQPTLERAKTHAADNIDLLRKAALAEAAFGGVKIRTRGSRRKPTDDV